jgi:5-methylcytosine-specific restriction endonuclease McrA
MLQRKTPLARTGRLPRTTKKQAATRKQVSAACPLDAHCTACGTSQQLTRSHCLTQKQWPQHRANPLNVVTLCVECHNCFEHQKIRFALTWPAVWAEKLRRIRALEPSAYAFIQMKFPSLF